MRVWRTTAGFELGTLRFGKNERIQGFREWGGGLWDTVDFLGWTVTVEKKNVLLCDILDLIGGGKRWNKVILHWA